MTPEQVFAARVREARLRLGMSQASCARRLGITRSMMSGLELGRFLARTVLLVKLAGVLEVSVDWLLGLSECQTVAEADGVSEVAAQLSPSNRAWWVGLGKDLVREQTVMCEQVTTWTQQPSPWRTSRANSS